MWQAKSSASGARANGWLRRSKMSCLRRTGGIAWRPRPLVCGTQGRAEGVARRSGLQIFRLFFCGADRISSASAATGPIGFLAGMCERSYNTQVETKQVNQEVA